MAALTGYLANSAFGGSVNARLSQSFDRFNADEIIGWPPSASLIDQGFTAPVQSNLPVSVVAKALLGTRLNTYLDDLYYRIHIIPLNIALGNVSSSQGANVVLWNAYLVSQTVVSVTGLEEGITITPPGTPPASIPYTLPALSETSWGISVAAEGPPAIDATISWNFDNINAPTVHITGMRVTMWPFVPDWSQALTERLEWATDILTSSTGAEQRRALRISPRRYYEARFITAQTDRSHFDMVLAGNGAGVWALPLWEQMQTLSEDAPAGSQAIACETAHREWRPGTMVVLRGADVGDVFTLETGIVDAVLPTGITLQRPLQQDWPAGARLYPARSARFSQLPTVERVTDQAITTSITFEMAEANDWNAELPATTYRGFAVFDARPDESQNLTNQYLRLLLTLDNTAGLPAVTDTAKTGFTAQAHRWFLVGAQELDEFKRLLYALRGRQVSVWVPTHADDMQITAAAANDVLVIQNIGYARFGVNRHGRRDIRIERVNSLGNEVATYHRIIAAVDQGATERLSIDPPLADVIQPADVSRISFMALCRLDADSVALEHVGDTGSLTRASVVWRSVRDEVEEVKGV